MGPAARFGRLAGQEVSVAGTRGRIYDAAPGLVQLELTLGNTFITISGADQGRVLQAAADLRRLGN